MSLHIFISYRRSDTQAHADRLYDELSRILGAGGDLFKDVDSLPFGQDFIERITSFVNRSDLMLVLIGPGWLDARLTPDGPRRLDDPEDFVRYEIRLALQRGVLPVPLFVGGCTGLPSPDDLPEDIRALWKAEGAVLNEDTWDTDVQATVRKMRKFLDEAPPPPEHVERVQDAAARGGADLPAGSLVASCSIGTRGLLAAVALKIADGWEVMGEFQRHREIGVAWMNEAIYERLGSHLQPERWKALRFSTDPLFIHHDNELRSIADTARRQLGRLQGGAIEVGPEPREELKVDGDEIADLLVKEAQILVDEIRALLNRNNLTTTAVARICLTDGAGDTPALVDAVRTALGFDKVVIDPALVPDKPSIDEETVLDIVVKNQRLLATTVAISHGATRIELKDVDGVGYSHVHQTTNAVTSGVTRSFTVRAGGQTISIALNHSGWSGPTKNRSDEDNWRRLVAISQQLIEPRLLVDHVNRLKGGQSIQIGSLTLGAKGLWAKKGFGGRKDLTWDGFAEVKFGGGTVTILQKKANGKKTVFTSFSIANINAILLPNLLPLAAELFA